MAQNLEEHREKLILILCGKEYEELFEEDKISLARVLHIGP